MNRMAKMSEIPTLGMALLGGTLLGMIFYGGLWWTVRRCVSHQASSIWLVSSFPLRMIIATGGFYIVSQGDWRRLLACLLGFLVARIGVTRLLRLHREQKT
jgi:F1F0 ATPase subunit 2